MTNFTAFGSYLAGDTPLHRLNATFKLLVSLIVVPLIFIIPNLTGLIILGAGFLGLVFWSRLPLKRLWLGLRPLLFILLLTMGLHLFWGADVSNTLSFKQRFLTGLFFTSRLCLAVFYGQLLMMTTTPTSLAEALEKALGPLKFIGLPTGQIALIITLALRFIPTIYNEAYIIMKAQEARGADFKRLNLKALKQYLAILIPLFVTCFRRAEELATALQIRGRT